MKLGFLVDLNLCMGCKGCEIACKVENEVPLSSWRLRVKYIDIGTVRYLHCTILKTVSSMSTVKDVSVVPVV